MSRSGYSSLGAFAMVPRRAPRFLRPAAVKDFAFTYVPFNMAIGQGTGGGINFYTEGAVPNTPTYPGNAKDFQFNFSLSSMQTLIAGGGGGALAAALNDSVTDYQSLFDSWRINKIRIQMVYNANSQSQQMGQGLPNICLVNDYDDSNSTSMSSLTQYDSFKVIQMGSAGKSSQFWTMKPRTQSTVLTVSGSSLSLMNGGNPWLDTAVPTCQYFGVKGYVDSQQAAAGPIHVGYVTFYVKVWCQMRNTR